VDGCFRQKAETELNALCSDVVEMMGVIRKVFTTFLSSQKSLKSRINTIFFVLFYFLGFLRFSHNLKKSCTNRVRNFTLIVYHNHAAVSSKTLY